jgi:hypothetical protein
MTDRFRPDAAVRRVSPSPHNVRPTGSIFRDHPRAGFKALSGRVLGPEDDEELTRPA